MSISQNSQFNGKKVEKKHFLNVHVCSVYAAGWLRVT